MKQHLFDARRRFAVLVFLMAAPWAESATSVRYRVLVRNGDPVPGVAGATYQSFSAPVLNRRSVVFFGARIAGGSAVSSNDFVLVAGISGAWSYVARESDSVAGLPPGVCLGPGEKPFRNLRLNDAGYVAFVSGLAGAGVSNLNDTCLVWGRPGALRVVAREGDPIPGATEGETFSDLAQLDGLNLLIGGSDDIGFAAQWRGPTRPGINAGVWLGPATNLSLLVRDGQAAPGYLGATMKNLQFATARLNPAGGIAFAGQTTDFPLDTAIWAGTTNGLRAVWREGAAMPGTNLVFGGFSAATLNVNTQYCFVATLAGVPAATDSAIVAGTETNLRVVAREGCQAPGMPPGVVFQELALVQPLFGAGNDVAFTATVAGPGIGTTNGTAVWAGQPGALRVVSRRGDPAVDTPTGVVYSTSFAATFSLAGLNADGEVVFMSHLEGPGIGLTNDQGLWGGTPGFESLLLQRNDPIDLGDGQPHAVHMIDLVDISGELQNGGGQDGRARSLNDLNQYVASLVFKAGQGNAIVAVEDVTDVDLDGLSRLLECAHGIPLDGSADHANLSLARQGAGLVLRYQEGAGSDIVSLELREADSLGGTWRSVASPVSNALDQTGVDPGAVRREALLPVNAPSRFYRLQAVVQDSTP